MKKGGKYIAEGAFGCVFYPHLKCKNGFKVSNSIGKVFYEDEAYNIEKKVASRNKQIDPKNDFTLPMYGSCKVNMSKVSYRDQIDNCSLISPGYKNFNQIIYKYGGNDLGEIINNLDQYDSLYIDDLFPRFLPVLKGIIKMQKFKGGLCHTDIKPRNILFDSNTNHIYLIDMGMIRDLKDLTLKKSAKLLNFEYPYYPPEFIILHCLNNKIYDKTHIYETFLNNLSWFDKYEFMDYINKYYPSYRSLNDFIKKGIALKEKDFKKDFNTIFSKKVDIYSLGISMFEVYYIPMKEDTIRIRNTTFIDEIMKELIIPMIHFDAYKRLTAEQAYVVLHKLCKKYKLKSKHIVHIDSTIK